jgi:AraC-like DNA-binding protein
MICLSNSLCQRNKDQGYIQNPNAPCVHSLAEDCFKYCCNCKHHKKDSIVGVVIKGHLTLRINANEVVTIPSGDWFFLAYHNQPIEIEKSSDIEGVVITQSFQYLETLLDASEQVAQSYPEKIYSTGLVSGYSAGRIHTLTELLLNEPAFDVCNRLLKTAYGHELLARILQQPEFLETASTQETSIQRDLPKLQAVAQYLDENLDEDHSLNDLCRRHYINEFKLKKGFREYYKTTVFGYLRQKRMEYAHRLLLESNDNILTIANSVGYTNASHFARAFRQVYGVNPKTVQQSLLHSA